jgi:signal transduction histidine kinase
MTTTTLPTQADHSRRIEELGRIIMAYSEVTDKLQQSHEQLNQTVLALQAELGEKNRQLERKNRLAALGEMAAGLAHEIRNPLGGIQLYASILAKDVADRSDSLSVVQKISGGVRRLEALVGQVLQFSREMKANVSLMDLGETIEQAVEMATPAFNDRGIRCVLDGPKPMHVTADSLLIGQIVLNLLLNGAEAMEDGGDISVRFSAPPADSDAKQFHLVIRDGGPGIPPQILDRIFNPFFTTKETGTGLGLAIVHRVVEAHDGTIMVTNPDGGGARFEIRI